MSHKFTYHNNTAIEKNVIKYNKIKMVYFGYSAQYNTKCSVFTPE